MHGRYTTNAASISLLGNVEVEKTQTAWVQNELCTSSWLCLVLPRSSELLRRRSTCRHEHATRNPGHYYDKWVHGATSLWMWSGSICCNAPPPPSDMYRICKQVVVPYVALKNSSSVRWSYIRYSSFVPWDRFIPWSGVNWTNARILQYKVQVVVDVMLHTPAKRKHGEMRARRPN